MKKNRGLQIESKKLIAEKKHLKSPSNLWLALLNVTPRWTTKSGTVNQCTQLHQSLKLMLLQHSPTPSKRDLKSSIKSKNCSQRVLWRNLDSQDLFLMECLKRLIMVSRCSIKPKISSQLSVVEELKKNSKTLKNSWLLIKKKT